MSNKKEYDEILDLLREQFPGRLLINVQELADVSGYKKQTIYNRIYSKSSRPFFISPVRPNGKPLFRINDVARGLSELS